MAVKSMIAETKVLQKGWKMKMLKKKKNLSGEKTYEN